MSPIDISQEDVVLRDGWGREVRFKEVREIVISGQTVILDGVAFSLDTTGRLNGRWRWNRC